MTELSFLLDILLNHKLGKATKDAIKARIDEIQKDPMPIEVHRSQPSYTIRESAVVPVHNTAQPLPMSEVNIGQTPAAQAALQQRAEMIRQGTSGVITKGHTSPPKSYHL